MSMRSTTPWCSCVPRPVADAGEVGDDAVHGENAVGGDHPEAGGLGFLETGLQVGHVVVLVAVALRLAEADAIDDRGVVQLVGDDGVFRAEQGLEQPAVGIERRRVKDRVVGAQKGAERLFELFVDRLRPADEADAGHAVAPFVERLVGGADDFGVVGHAEIVIGA
jgi:hypothetical protein